MPKVSVLMPVYNTKEEYLRESIESILKQTFTDFEFIIINDGSTNNAKDVILSYQDSRIKYYEQENQGIAATLNRGLDLSQGEYIARMDADDISMPERLKKQTEFLDVHSDISVLGSWCEFFPKQKVMKYIAEPKYLDFIKFCQICHPAVMLRSNILKQYNLKYNSKYKCEDYELWSRAIKFVKFYNIPEVLLKYRWHENNISKISEKFSDDVEKVKQNMLDFLTNNEMLKYICKHKYSIYAY